MPRPSTPAPAPMRTPDELQREHQELDARVRELDRRAILTPEEQRERSDLKKRKLALKDELTRVSNVPPEPVES